MRPQAELDALVEAEEFAGGPMTAPAQMTKTGNVIVATHPNGDWQADCTQCGAGCGVAGVDAPGDDLDTDAPGDEDRMLDDFTAAHRDCTVPSFGEDLPSPAQMCREIEPRPTVWIVRGTNGSDIRVLAERHTTYARPDGTELRFYNGDGDKQHRVASVRAGSWHWCVAEPALNPETGEQS